MQDCRIDLTGDGPAYDANRAEVGSNIPYFTRFKSAEDQLGRTC